MSNLFINPEKNDNFAHFRGPDLQNLLVETENFFLEYRDKLNLPSDVTFGIELEYEGILKFITDKYIKENLKEWNSKKDGSLRTGGEIASPIMTDDLKWWHELKTVCDYLSKRKADTLHNAGGHIHIGTCALGEDVEAWKCFLKLYTAYEHVIFRFVYGDKISARKKILNYASPIADLIYNEIDIISRAKSIFEIFFLLSRISRYSALNFDNVDVSDPGINNNGNTLEFRSPNATVNAIVWQNNINAFAKMLVASRNKVMDEEFLDYKLDYEYLPYFGNEYRYSSINLKNVLEFVDLVFDNNLDKIYFLRQYLKNFQENYRLDTAVKARRFVK